MLSSMLLFFNIISLSIGVPIYLISVLKNKHNKRLIEILKELTKYPTAIEKEIIQKKILEVVDLLID